MTEQQVFGISFGFAAALFNTLLCLSIGTKEIFSRIVIAAMAALPLFVSIYALLKVVSVK